MGLNTASVVDALDSLCAATGLFQKSITFEPKRAPDGDMTAATWFQTILTAPEHSGLAKSSVVVVYNIRLYTNMLQEPPDAIDPSLVTATDTILTNLHSDFDLGSSVGFVDLLGQTGVSLRAEAGYLDIDGTMFRIVDITVPCVLFDAWTQTA